MLILAAIGLFATVICLRWVSYRRWYAIMLRLSEKSAEFLPLASAESTIRQVLRLFRIAVRRAPLPGNCLSQSLTLWWLLRRQGIESELHIGTCYQNDRFEAHAWVEYAGYPLNDSSDVRSRFSPFNSQILSRDSQIV